MKAKKIVSIIVLASMIFIPIVKVEQRQVVRAEDGDDPPATATGNLAPSGVEDRLKH